MTTFGTNMKLTVDREKRTKLDAIFRHALGCASEEPNDDLVLYRLADGFLIGVYYVAGDAALAEEELRKAPWLELTVEDLESTADKLIELGASTVEYFDKAHRYFQAPGGPVFRLASSRS